MRNLNTTIVKNEIRRFGFEAGQVLRALANPATCLPRLMQSVVRMLLVYLMPTRQQWLLAPTGTTAGKAGLPSPHDRIVTVTFDQTFTGEYGISRPGWFAGQTVS